MCFPRINIYGAFPQYSQTYLPSVPSARDAKVSDSVSVPREASFPDFRAPSINFHGVSVSGQMLSRWLTGHRR